MPGNLDIDRSFYVSKQFDTTYKLLVGPGPANCSPRVLFTLANSPVLLPGDEIYKVMADLKEMLKYMFQTTNEVTLAIQTSGTGGLEAALLNVVDPGEKIIVAIGGIWGERIVQMAKIRGINVVELRTEPGEVFLIGELEKEIAKHRPILLFITHGESSTGLLQPLEGLGVICHKYGCLLAVDAIVTMGAIPLYVDRLNIDIAVSATQKAARSLPGLAYLTFSPNAVTRMRSIKTQPPFYYNILSLSDVWKCFSRKTKYYYTYSSNLLYAAKEGIAEIVEDGLENTWENHKNLSKRLWKGLEEIGLKLLVEKPQNRLWTVTCVCLPSDVTWTDLNAYLVEKYQLYMGTSIGLTPPNIVRIGVMGYNARASVVDYVVEKLDEAIKYCKEKNKSSK